MDDLDLLPNPFCRLGCGDESVLHPSVPDAARVPGAHSGNEGPGSVRPVSRAHVDVLAEHKVRQLVELDGIERAALVFVLVFLVLHVPELDFRPARESPHVLAAVEPGSWKRSRIIPLGLAQQLLKLFVCLTQDQRPIVRDVHLPQRIDDQHLRLAAAGRAADEDLVLASSQHLFLRLLRFPDDVIQVEPPSRSPAAGSRRTRPYPRRCASRSAASQSWPSVPQDPAGSCPVPSGSEDPSALPSIA